MKYTHAFLAPSAAIILFGGQFASGTTLPLVQIGISPYQSTEDATAIRRRVGQFILEAPAGTKCIIHDAYAMNEIARFDIPKLRFDSPEIRAQRLQVPFAKLAAWYKQLPGKETVPLLKDSGALKVPEFMQKLSQEAPSEPYAVLLIGNPLNLSIDEPAFSMAGGRVPTDGHLLTNLVGSIYGTAEKKDHLRRCYVRQCYLRETIWRNQVEKQAYQRFWSLFISQQSGTLVDFNGDLDHSFSSVLNVNLPPLGYYQIDRANDIIEMRLLHERAISTHATRPLVPVTAPIVTNFVTVPVFVTLTNTIEKVHTVYKTNIVVQTVKAVEIPVVPIATNMPPIPVAPKGRMGIAAWWSDDVDVDLYVSIPGEKELFFQNVTNKYGTYYRDIRVANQCTAEEAWRAQWEYVELTDDAPVTQVACWLNLYKVNRRITHPIDGKVRIQFPDGHFAETPFRFDVKKGNGGADSEHRNSSPYWVPICIHPSSTQQ